MSVSCQHRKSPKPHSITSSASASTFAGRKVERLGGLERHGLIKHHQAGGRAARSTFRVAPADVVKALLDCGEARFDHRLKFEVGEDIWPVLFDAFADEFTGIDGIYALRDACPDHIDLQGTWARSRQGTDRPLEALGEIAP